MNLIKFKQKLDAKLNEVKHKDFVIAADELSSLIAKHFSSNSRGLTGWNHAEMVCTMAHHLGHPHARWTLDHERGNFFKYSPTDRKFGNHLSREYAYLIATNLLN